MDAKKINLLVKDIKTKQKIDTTSWKKHKIENLFEVLGTKTTKKRDIEQSEGPYPYITTRSSNNGVDGYSNIYTETGGVLVVDSAVLGFMTYQDKNFSASDHVEKLVPKFKMNKFIALYICCVWNHTFSGKKFTYSNKASQKAIRAVEIMLPTNSLGNPDFQYMENYIKNSFFGNLLKDN